MSIKKNVVFIALSSIYARLVMPRIISCVVLFLVEILHYVLIKR